jgi:hypothetical protein
MVTAAGDLVKAIAQSIPYIRQSGLASIIEPRENGKQRASGVIQYDATVEE